MDKNFKKGDKVTIYDGALIDKDEVCVTYASSAVVIYVL